MPSYMKDFTFNLKKPVPRFAGLRGLILAGFLASAPLTTSLPPQPRQA
jgi:hypothetical protein